MPNTIPGIAASELRSNAAGTHFRPGERPSAVQILLTLAATGVLVLAGCGTSGPAAALDAASPAAQSKPATPAIPDEVQGAAKSLLGSGVQVLAYGDLAKNGNQELLAVNVLPKTPTNAIPGLVVTRATIAESRDGKWIEMLHCDEHLKNQKGFLALTPVQPVTAWRLQFEQDDAKGLQLYFTAQRTGDAHVLPIGVGWNPKTQRYQSLDRAFEHFLPEALQMGAMPRSTLR